MSNFDIAFTGKVIKDDPLIAEGVIQLGAHREVFLSDLTFWSVELYRTSWIGALRRLADGGDVSCLLTSVLDPTLANFFTVWPLYRSGDRVFVQNHLVFVDELDRNFDPSVPWEYIAPRATVDEDGDLISEWEISFFDVEEFIAAESS
ncbi:hypothetical protein AB0L00_39275 [Actinoallomurus sp. NPDC052308]|uniref:hypothetical protein n=1 Tax=Actinoallomurus sp. NPDC052308 TaxID=3155530 RepID=UPI003444068A